MADPVTAGRPAPPFALVDHDGGPVTLDGFAGRPLVLFFYPKDDTAGCTAEALAFSALAPAFREAEVAVLGVSPDSPASHAKFRAKHGLDVALASDESRAACEGYGVWVEKSMYGRRYMGVERTTVLVDADGVVRQVWPKVKVAGHAAAVLAAAAALDRQAGRRAAGPD